MTVQFTVWGVAQPQGNKSAFIVGKKTANPKIALREGRRGDAAERFKGWRAAVADGARRCQERTRCGLLDGAIEVAVCFYLPRPKSAPKRLIRPVARPDADKLARLVGDAITGVLIGDDSRIVAWTIEKWFARDGVAPCAVIRVRDAQINAVPSLFPAHSIDEVAS